MKVDDYRNVGKSENFSDFYNKMTVHPDTGELLRKVDAAAINQSIKNLLLTNEFERPFSDMGTDIRSSLFENFTAVTEADLNSKITNTIKNHEPRANLQKVTVTPNQDGNSILIMVYYVPIYQTELQQLKIVINRIR